MPEKQKPADESKNKAHQGLSDAQKVLEKAEEEQNEVQLPDVVEHCVLQPSVMGALTGQKPGTWMCPKDIPHEPACAYYKIEPSDNPDKLHMLQLDNPCVLCIEFFNNQQVHYEGKKTYSLMGYTKTACPQVPRKEE